ncbi:hypothetical protein [Aquipseudomonas alcaligenes]|uniref:hypothetical protein n=1 Tax=Aquipseudomonas alcaligenes TaxID=43263 RepID=UPI0019455ACD|nr:hypothetical protein [Pseudomonas alcaligenes]
MPIIRIQQPLGDGRHGHGAAHAQACGAYEAQAGQPGQSEQRPGQQQQIKAIFAPHAAQQCAAGQEQGAAQHG